MAETANIARAGEEAFKTIFERFGWQRTGPMNTNWPCVSPHPGAGPETGKAPKTHPSDAVWYYDDAYLPKRVFVNVDFKSYARDSLESIDLSASLRSLGRAVECANKSEEFQERFYEGNGGETVGLLFVYNHDNEYDPSHFARALAKVAPDAFDLPKRRRMYVLGPDRISYLLTIAIDSQLVASETEVRDYKRSFFYPDLVGAPARTDSAWSLDSLMGPWQILKLTGARGNRPHVQYHIYIDGDGERLEDFEYLIDYLFRYQLLEAEHEVFLRLVNPIKNAPLNFDAARKRYVARLLGLDEINQRLSVVKYKPVQMVKSVFSDIELGMRE